MGKFLKRHSKSAGLPPGTLVHVGERRMDRTEITVMDYDADGVREHAVSTPEECRAFLDQPSVTWINVTGLHDMDLMRRVGEVFGIHSLTLEDILNTGQRPKLEDYGDYLCLVLKMLYRGSGDQVGITAEQVSVLLRRRWVLTFQEMEGDVFGLIRERIRKGAGRIRRMGCDYLAYSLLDAVVDHYFVVLEDVGDRVEAVQEKVVSRADTDTLDAIHQLKRELIFLRKNLWPMREVVSRLERAESNLWDPVLAPYLRDVYEHTIQVIDNTESLRDLLSGAMDIYMTTLSNRMNEVMKVLTVIATIFIPLTFIAGIYGMNFQHMPELAWRLGYLGAWCVMVAVAAGMIVYFRRKDWL